VSGQCGACGAFHGEPRARITWRNAEADA
jgi:hypothetical protein